MESGEADIFLFNHRSGEEIIWYQIAVALYKTGLIVSCNNITEQKRIEEKLKYTEANFRLLTENATDVICRLDLKSHFIYVSPVPC